MKPQFFETQNDFREWLNKNHVNETVLLVGFYKVGSKKPSMTWPESVDQALCYGWIDGVRKSIDEESYSVRFTPRKPTSIWSNVNINKVKALTEKGLMMPKGIAAFSLRKESKSGIYSFENEPKTLDSKLESKFKSNKKAWDFFQKSAPSHQKQIIYWIASAKKEETRLSRLEKAIEKFEKGEKF